MQAMELKEEQRERERKKRETSLIVCHYLQFYARCGCHRDKRICSICLNMPRVSQVSWRQPVMRPSCCGVCIIYFTHISLRANMGSLQSGAF